MSLKVNWFIQGIPYTFSNFVQFYNLVVNIYLKLPYCLKYMESIKRISDMSTVGGPSKVPHLDLDEHNHTAKALVGRITCDLCSTTFPSSKNLNRHQRSLHADNTFACDICAETFSRKDNLSRHMKSHKASTVPLAAVGDPHPSTDPRNPASANCPPSGCKTALKGSFERHRVEGSEHDVDLSTFLRSQPHVDLIREALKPKKAVKFFVSVNMKMVRPKNWITRGDSETEPYFTSRCYRAYEISKIDDFLQMAYDKIVNNMADYLREGSGWVVDHVNFVDLVISTYKPLAGSSYIPTPRKILWTRGVTNVKNMDQKCFMWAILSALHPVQLNSHRLSHYTPYEDSLNMGDLKFPISPDDIPEFEKLNGLHVNLFGYSENELFPIYISKDTAPYINLLLMSDGVVQHYCWINDLNKLMLSEIGGYD